MLRSIEARRFVARNIYDAEGWHPLCFVDLSGEIYSAVPFQRETEATVFEDRRILLINRRYLDDPRMPVLLDTLRRVGILPSPYSDIFARSGITPSADTLPIPLD